MPINYSMAVKNARLQTVVNSIDNVAPGGVLVIGTAELAGDQGVLAAVPLDTPSFTIDNGVMTLANPPRTVAATGAGQAALAELRNGAGTTIASGMIVGLAGSNPDVIINALSISVGQTVQVTMGSITHAP